MFLSYFAPNLGYHFTYTKNEKRGVFMKTTATIMQVSRSLLILTPAEYDKPEGAGQLTTKKTSVPTPTVFGTPQLFPLPDTIKDHPFQKAPDLAAFVKRAAESVGLQIGELFVCVEDEENVVSTEYTHPAAKEKLLPAYARVEAEKILHGDISAYTLLNSEYGYQFGRAKKSEDLQAALFAMNSKTIADIKIEFEKLDLHVVKIVPPITALIHSAKKQINSSAKTVAVISLDYVATRLVILHNGAPVFQQTFSGVLEDVAELLSLEFGISPLGAIDLIRENGLGVCDRCNDPNTRKQTMGLLDNAAGEILRTIRMIISTQKIDIDEIAICDNLSRLSNLANYCRSIGLTAPIESITNLFTSGVVVPTPTENAVEKGYNASCFITMNAILDMPVIEGNFLGGESGLASLQKTATLGGKITAGVGIAVAVWMLCIGGFWIFLNIRQSNDKKELDNQMYAEAKQLLADETEYTNRISSLEKDKKILPSTIVRMADACDNIFQNVEKKSLYLNSITLNNSDNNIEVQFTTKNDDDFVKIRSALEEDGFFNVNVDFKSALDQNSTNVKNTMYLSISSKTYLDALENKEKEEGDDKAAGSSTTAADDKKADTTSSTSDSTSKEASN